MYGRGLLRSTSHSVRRCQSRVCTTRKATEPKHTVNHGGATTSTANETGMMLTTKSMGIGMGAGLLGSLVGMGGGFVAIPALTGWLRLTQHQAHGTSLGAVFATGAAGSSAYALSGQVDYEAAAAMAVAGMVASHIGARATAGMSASTLKLALGVLMITVAPLLPLRDSFFLGRTQGTQEESGEISAAVESSNTTAPLYSSKATASVDKVANVADPKSSNDSSSTARKVNVKVGQKGLHGGGECIKEENYHDKGNEIGEGEGMHQHHHTWWQKLPKMFAIGLGSGFLAGVFGVGGGVVTVPAISLATDLGHKEVLGTSLAAMVLPALTGSATHFWQGNLMPKIALPLAVGTGLGAFLGGNYAARRLDEETLKWGFSVVMVVLGARTISGARMAISAAAKRPR